MGVVNSGYSSNINSNRSAIDRALSKLLSDGGARISERNRKFLHFVVQETIAGRGDRIKAYSIGVDVFGRSEDFDPNVDPIVRIEATRLRSALEAYYNGPGASDDVKIIMKPGSYIPLFERPASPGSSGCSLLGGPVSYASQCIVLSHGTDPRNKSAYSCGILLVNTLVQRLIAKSYRVFFAPSPRQKPRGRSFEDVVGSDDRVFGLEVSVLPITGGKRHVWSLSDLETGELYGVDDLDQISDDLPSASSVAELTDRIFRSVVEMTGAIRSQLFHRPEPEPRGTGSVHDKPAMSGVRGEA